MLKINTFPLSPLPCGKGERRVRGLKIRGVFSTTLHEKKWEQKNDLLSPRMQGEEV